MTIDEFDRGMNKLVNVFGERVYTVERKDLLYNRLRNMSYTEWSETVDNLILSNRQPPMAKEFDEAVNAAKSKLGSNFKGMLRSNCTTCDTFGCVLKTDSANGTLYAFRCPNCEASQNFTGLPEWNGKIAWYPA